LYQLAQVLVVVAARLEPREAAATLTQAMALTKTAAPAALQPLAQGLAAVAARLEPKEAAALCKETATTLTHVLTKTTPDGSAWPPLAQGLAALAARLEAREAATTLTQAMTKARGRDSLQQL